MQQVAEHLLGSLGPQEIGQEDGYIHDEPLLAHVYGASMLGTQALGLRQGWPVTRLVEAWGEPRRPEGPTGGAPILSQHEGFGVYTDRAFDARDRKRLFQMCRYPTRPPGQARTADRTPLWPGVLQAQADTS